MESVRTCRICQRSKPLESFPRNRPDGSRHHRWLACQAQAYKTRYQVDSSRRAFQIAYSMNGSVGRQYPDQAPLRAEALADLILQTPACTYCGEANSEAGQGFQLDHVIPRSKGGQHTLENLALCCAQCNRAKWDLTLEEFQGWLKRVADRQAPLNVL